MQQLCTMSRSNKTPLAADLRLCMWPCWTFTPFHNSLQQTVAAIRNRLKSLNEGFGCDFVHSWISLAKCHLNQLSSVSWIVQFFPFCKIVHLPVSFAVVRSTCFTPFAFLLPLLISCFICFLSIVCRVYVIRLIFFTWVKCITWHVSSSLAWSSKFKFIMAWRPQPSTVHTDPSIRQMWLFRNSSDLRDHMEDVLPHRPHAASDFLSCPWAPLIKHSIKASTPSCFGFCLFIFWTVWFSPGCTSGTVIMRLNYNLSNSVGCSSRRQDCHILLGPLSHRPLQSLHWTMVGVNRGLVQTAAERTGIEGKHRWSLMIPTVSEVKKPFIGIQHPLLHNVRVKIPGNWHHLNWATTMKRSRGFDTKTKTAQRPVGGFFHVFLSKCLWSPGIARQVISGTAGL